MQVKVDIYKGVRGVDGHFDSYTLEAEPSDMVLDILEMIYHDYDPTLSYRYACGVARCGECGLRINGDPYLACDKLVEPYLRIEPLDHLPMIRDTVIDRRAVFDHLHKILPPAENISENISATLEAIPQEDALPAIENSIRLTTCYECLICQSMCPRYQNNLDGFPGPFGLLELMQMHENPAQKPFDDSWLEMLSATCVRCGKCVRCCPADKNPLDFALKLLKHSPRTAYRVGLVNNGETQIQEVVENV